MALRLQWSRCKCPRPQRSAGRSLAHDGQRPAQVGPGGGLDVLRAQEKRGVVGHHGRAFRQLVLGHVAARAALGRTEPLGRLRAGPHALAGCPAVVTYDPAFLLRSQDNKAAAWADLCRALAIVRQASPG